MLCPACDTERRRAFDEAKKAKLLRSTGTKNTSTVATVDGTAIRNTPTSISASSLKPAADATVRPTSGAMATDDAQTSLVVNELLAYVIFYRDQATTEALHKVVVGFYLPSEITEAKRRLIAEFAAQLTGCPYKVARRQSASRTAHDAEAPRILFVSWRRSTIRMLSIG